MQIEVSERRDTPGAWGVEAVNVDGDGEIYMAVFSGPDAERRARDYAVLIQGGRMLQKPSGVGLGGIAAIGVLGAGGRGKQAMNNAVQKLG